MPSRRRFLTTSGVVLASVLGGCSMPRGESDPVTVLLLNDDTEPWQVTAAVDGPKGEELFRTVEQVPADSGEDLGRVSIEEAFSGDVGTQYTVRAWLDDDPAGTFDYTLTCPDDNRFSLLVEHTPYDPDDGEPIDYVADRCGE